MRWLGTFGTPAHMVGRIMGLACTAALLAANSCSYGHRIAYHVLEGPLDAVAVTHLEPDKLLILAGDDDGKGVSVFHDSIHSQEVLRFGVPRFASDIQAGSNERFYLSIAVPQDYDNQKHAGGGAIEEWNLHGQMLSETRFPAPVVAITKPVDGVMYALLETKGLPIAVALRLADAKVLGSVPLQEAARSLDQCVLAGQVYLLTSSPRTHHVYLLSAKSGYTVDTGMVAEQPRCFSNSTAIAGIAMHPTRGGNRRPAFSSAAFRQQQQHSNLDQSRRDRRRRMRSA